MGSARRQVIEILGSLDGPVTAEAVAARLPDIHVSSVYRSLNLLEELGVVRHVHLAHGPALYELTDVADGIRHLACERCGRDVVVPTALFDDLRAGALDGEIPPHGTLATVRQRIPADRGVGPRQPEDVSGPPPWIPPPAPEGSS